MAMISKPMMCIFLPINRCSAIMVTLWCISTTTHAFAAQQVEAQSFVHLLETIYNQYEGEVAYEVFREQLWAYYHNPLTLHQASMEELQHLYMLTEDQLYQLLEHIAKNGPLISIYELQAIPGFDSATIKQLLPFIKVETVDVPRQHQILGCKAMRPRDNYVLTRYERTLELRKGYLYHSKQRKVPYIGSPNQLFTRLHIHISDCWSFGLSARKGAGETLLWPPTIPHDGPLPHRVHIRYKGRKVLQTLIIGDYAVGYGQGVVLHAGFCMNKGSEVIKVIRTNNLGIRPHTSVSTAAFRGIATTWQWLPLALTVYYSMIDLDGKVYKNASGRKYVRSVARGGYYKTQSDLDKKGKITEQVVGSTLVYQSAAQDAELGVNLLYSYYNVPICPDTKRSNPYRFRGQHHANSSLFYRYVWQNLHFFGEGALSRNKRSATIIGVVASLSHYIDVTLLGRYYGQRFHSLHGKAFRENTASNSNERGIYVGAGLHISRQLHMESAYDYFQFPWYLRELCAGHSWLMTIHYQPIRSILVRLRYKTKTKPHQQTAHMGTRQDYKFDGQYTLGRLIHLRSEAKCSRYQQQTKSTWGYAFGQRMTIKMQQLKLELFGVWFQAKDYSNRQYFYEPNVLHTGFNFRAHQGKGVRYGLLIGYRPITNFRLELKYVRTQYKHPHTIGSGYQTISGKTQNDVVLQTIFRF